MLTSKEAREWKSLQAKGKRNRISIRRVSVKNSNVVFGDGIYAQLGTGHATDIMDAKITVKKARARRK